jgi:NADPH2:quinone reductase
MRAWIMERTGEPEDVLRLVDDFPEPPMGPDELRIEVETIGLNFPDLLLIRGEYQLKLPLPCSPCNEVVGRVVEAGPDCPIPLGTRVMGTTLLENPGLAERTVLCPRDAMPLPDSVASDVAACFYSNYNTAHLALHHRARLQAGETVLVHGAAGGVGSVALQIARAAGARVIGTDRGADRKAGILENGADLALDIDSDDIAAAVNAFTEDRGVDVVIDMVGGDVFDGIRRYIAFEGRVVIVGFVSGRIAELKTNHLILRNFTVMGVNAITYGWEHQPIYREACREALNLYVRGAIKGPVFTTLPFEQAPAALTALAERRVIGKAVLVL